MQYYDVDYIINLDDKFYMQDEDKIVDVYIKRTDHYCEQTESYWDSKQDEAIYLKLQTSDGFDKIVCACKNVVSESEVYFDKSSDKENFYQVKHGIEFYNQVYIYLTFSDEQAVTFLNIMKDNIDDYDYNFQYCSQDRIIKNMVKPSFDNTKVEKAYSKYLESFYQKDSLEEMVSESENNNVVKFQPKK